MSLYNEYNKNNKSTTKSGLYSEYTKSKTKTAQPSLLKKALSFGKEIVLDTKKNVVDKPLTNVVQAGQALTKLPEIIRTGKATFTPMTPFNYKGTPVQPLGTRTFDAGGIDLKNPKAGLKNTAKDLLDIGGTGLEMASFMGFGPSAKAGFTVTTQLAKGATKKAGQTLLRSSAEGAFGGLTQNIGTQLQDNAATGKAFNPMETLKATAGGAVLAPALNVFSRGIGNIFAGKRGGEVLLEDTIVNRLSSTVDNSLEKKISGVRDKSLDYFKQNPQEITKQPIKLREVDGKVVIEDGRHRLQAAKELGIPNIRTEDVTPQYPQVQGQFAPKSDIISSIIRDGKAAPELTQQALSEVPKTFTPKLSTELEANAIEKGFIEKFGDLPQVQTMNTKDESLKWADLVEKDYEAAKRAVLTDTLPEGFNNSIGLGYEAVVRKAVKEGDWQFQKELATNPNAAPTQASLTAQKLKSFDNNLVDSTDSVELMKSLSKARESVIDIKQKGVKKTDIQTLDNVTKPKIPKEDWTSFINNIPDC